MSVAALFHGIHSVNIAEQSNCPCADNVPLKSEFGTLVPLLWKGSYSHTQMPVMSILLICPSTSHPGNPAFMSFCIFRAADKILAETESVWEGLFISVRTFFPWRHNEFLVELSDFPQGVRVGREKKKRKNWGRILWLPVWCHHAGSTELFWKDSADTRAGRWHLGCCVWPGAFHRVSGRAQSPSSSQGRSLCPHHSRVLFPFLPLSRQTNMFCVNTHHNRLASNEQPKQITDKIPLST